MNVVYCTGRLVIRPASYATFYLESGWIGRHVSWLNDPEVVKYSEQRHAKHTFESQSEYIASFNHPNKYLDIHLDDDTHIGTMTVYVDEPNKVANVGIMIGDKSQWNKGYGFEAWKFICDDLFDNGIRKIEAGCMEPNEAMRYIFVKYGMFYEAYISRHFLLENGSTTGKVLYGKFAQ